MLFEFLEILDIIEKKLNEECEKNCNCNKCIFTNCSDCEDLHLFDKIREIAEIALK